MGGVTEGFGKDFSKIKYNSPDFELLDKLTYNAGTFAAFKNHSQIRETVRLLKDADGNLRSKSEFIKEALKLDKTYNKRYLSVEYDQAVTSGRMAKKWADAVRTQNLYPNLTYVAVMDDRTRDLHRKWHGITLPIGHKFWDTHYPPNDWACRCTTRRSDKPVDDKGLKVDDMPSLPKQFNINVGKEGKVFKEDHPYFKTSAFKAVATFAKNALVRFQTQSYYPKLKDTLAGTYKTDIGKVTVNNRAIKEALNQPHANAYLKNNLVGKLPELLKDAFYIKSLKPLKENPHWVLYHYLRLGDYDDMILVIREDRKGNYFFYSIVDKIKS
ncbi:hypothetical protein BFP77_08275 [Maribacter sp. 4U21]|uniref:phage minor head protein n=1 Tax=Maribacter sp. 4U21 TaxID=1889779 RepID=UPI000C15102E|nr:phage minor head protein [Maribacter sp. 4U21]PIB28903.1 hypothetical protein BFP77_08275 [Maribacter sp. 4U21]